MTLRTEERLEIAKAKENLWRKYREGENQYMDKEEEEAWETLRFKLMELEEEDGSWKEDEKSLCKLRPARTMGNELDKHDEEGLPGVMEQCQDGQKDVSDGASKEERAKMHDEEGMPGVMDDSVQEDMTGKESQSDEGVQEGGLPGDPQEGQEELPDGVRDAEVGLHGVGRVEGSQSEMERHDEEGLPGVMPGDSQYGQGELSDGVKDETESMGSERGQEESIGVKSDEEGLPGVTDAKNPLRGQEESIIGVNSD